MKVQMYHPTVQKGLPVCKIFHMKKLLMAISVFSCFSSDVTDPCSWWLIWCHSGQMSKLLQSMSSYLCHDQYFSDCLTSHHFLFDLSKLYLLHFSNIFIPFIESFLLFLCIILSLMQAAKG